MASTASVSGLVSGIDTDSLIKSLVALENQKVTAIERKKSATQATLSAFGELQSKVAALSTAAKELDELKDFDLYKNTSSDDNTVAVEGGGEGLEGSFSMRVQQLATSWKVSSGQFSSSVVALGKTGTFTLSRSASAIEQEPTKTTVDIDVQAGDTLKDIVRKINAADGAGVTATLVTLANNDVRMMLTSVDQGTGTFSIANKGASTIVDDLGILDTATKTAQSEFSLRLANGGAAKATTAFTSLFTGIGANNIGASDAITLNGTDANGSAITNVRWQELGVDVDLTTKTVGDLTTWLAGELGLAAGDVTINDSGEIVAKSASGPVTFTLGMSGGSGTLGLGGSTAETTFKNTITEGRRAFYTLNGLAMSSESNTDDDSLNGAKIILKNISQADDPDIQVKIVRDDDGIKKKVQTMLDSYNNLIKFIDEKSKSDITETTDANGNKVKNYVPGELTGQYVVTSLRSNLQKMMTSEVSILAGRTSYTSLVTLGIKTTAGGTLELDSEKFSKALSADFDGVRRLFANSAWTDNPSASVGYWNKETKTGSFTVDAVAGTIDGVAADRSGDVMISTSGDSNGLGLSAPASAGTFTATFSRGIAGMLDQYYQQITGFDGMLKNTKTSIQSQLTSYSEQITRAQDRVGAYRETLVNQFTAMEQAMLRLKSQSSAFSAQISSI
jgi:flagellar hook-associated protein 2